MEMTMMMSSQDSSGSSWYHGHGATGVGDGDGFFEMFDDLPSLLQASSGGSGDLFELVWQGGGPAGRSCTSETQAGGDSLPSSPLLSAGQPRPSNDEMAAWLRAIVCGGDVEQPVGKPAGGAVVADDQPMAAPAQETTTTTEAKHTVDTGSSCSKRKQRGRRSHHSGLHNLTEKRRRWKINEKFKTLQQLVPGCDNKSNQTSTLEQTIKHMKALQHQIQAMSLGFRIIEPPASAAVYPVVMPPPYYLAPPRPAAFAPGVVVTGGQHVWPAGAVVLGSAPPPAMPFAGTLLPLPMAAQQDDPRRR